VPLYVFGPSSGEVVSGPVAVNEFIIEGFCSRLFCRLSASLLIGSG
jgi:hypothetical protein